MMLKLSVTMVLLAGVACAEAAVEPPVQPVNRAPIAAGTIPDQTFGIGQRSELDVAAYFSDPDRDTLTYQAETSSAEVATADVSGSMVALFGVAEGTAQVTVTARDPGGMSAAQDFAARVVRPKYSITVAPPVDTVAPSDSVRLVASATDENGQPVGGLEFTWSSSDRTVAVVDPSSVTPGTGSAKALVRGRLEGATEVTATAGAAWGTATIAVVNPDPAALIALYEATDGQNWPRRANWLSDQPISFWRGVRTNGYRRVLGLYLEDNGLKGSLPQELGRLDFLEEFVLTDNAELSGTLPRSLVALQRLRGFWASNTGLCVPADTVLRAWLEDLERRRVASCDAAATMAYLTQAVQSREFPVPLVAGDRALLRVFVTSRMATDAGMPPVRASLYLPGGDTHVVNVAGHTSPIPATFSEGSLAETANAEIVGSLVQPGLEMVIEIDPEGTVDETLGLPKRIPDSGRLPVDVRAVPTFRFMVIPFIREATPDTSVLKIARAMVADPWKHQLLGQTRTLLPVGDLELDLHEPVMTSRSTALELLYETNTIRLMEAGDGHYLGAMTGQIDGIDGRAFQNGRSTFSMVDRGDRSEFVIAHELGHNMSLRHPPGCNAGSPDIRFPYAGGLIGAWGYDFGDGGVLVPPENSDDLMSYCYNRKRWISDYHFTNALAYRLVDESQGSAVTLAAPVKSLLLWGGVDARGQPYLEPAFIVDAPPALPETEGPYEVSGRTPSGEELFSLRFDMPEVADGDGSSGFVFALPVRGGWVGNLASITLAGPGGTATLDEDTNRPVTIVRNRRTGQIRGIFRDAPGAAMAGDDALAAMSAQPDMEVLTSRGIPDAW